jgi:hypothetical protein
MKAPNFELRFEVKRLSSRHRDHSPMFVGLYRFAWLRCGATWLLMAIEPVEGA